MIVKKYSNRRLYDTESSRYITLEELTAKIRGGSEARVVDARTGADLTQATLTQIIIEGRGADTLFPIPLLHQLIRLGDDALAEFLGRYVSTALELYLQARQGSQALGGFNPFGFNPFAPVSSLLRPMQGTPPPAPAPSAQPTEVELLRREMDELKRSLKTRRKR